MNHITFGITVPVAVLAFPTIWSSLDPKARTLLVAPQPWVVILALVAAPAAVGALALAGSVKSAPGRHSRGERGQSGIDETGARRRIRERRARARSSETGRRYAPDYCADVSVEWTSARRRRT